MISHANQFNDAAAGLPRIIVFKTPDGASIGINAEQVACAAHGSDKSGAALVGITVLMLASGAAVPVKGNLGEVIDRLNGKAGQPASLPGAGCDEAKK